MYQLLCDAGIERSFTLDPSITRGLDYYTGIVYETFLTELPQLGSVCSGGRYDNLTGLYMKEPVSGVGASIGLDRLLAGLVQLGIRRMSAPFIDVLIFYGKADGIRNAGKAALYLETLNIRAEVFPEAKKIQQQYAYAEKKRIPWGLFLESADNEARCDAGYAEWQVRLKHLPTRTDYEVLLKDTAAVMQQFDASHTKKE